MKPLIGIPSPRDIKTFKEHIQRLPADKLWLKYYKQLEAYERMRKYFLNHHYSHLIICPDDLIVQPYDLTRLIHGLIRHDYPVLSGMCNVDDASNTEVNITPLKHIPKEDIVFRQYVWMSAKSKRLRKGEIFQVGFAGFGFFAIRRDIVEQIPFRTDETGCCIDTFFCWDCHKAKIPIYVDPKINMLHLKVADGEYQNFGVGTKKAFTYLDKYRA